MSPFVKLAVSGAALLSLYATPAGAVDAVCGGTIRQTWTPGLRVLPAMVRYTNTSVFDQCTTSVPGITSGRIDVDATFFNSCVANAGPAEATVRWSDNSSSTIRFQGLGANVLGTSQVFVSLGQVTSGTFAGDNLVFINSFASTGYPPAPCLSPQGLTSLAGSTTMLLLPPLAPLPQ